MTALFNVVDNLFPIQDAMDFELKPEFTNQMREATAILTELWALTVLLAQDDLVINQIEDLRGLRAQAGIFLQVSFYRDVVAASPTRTLIGK
jgi:hypothetical protein